MLIPNAVRIFFSKENQNRGVERIRRAGLTGMTSMIGQGITIASGFISLPLTVTYLGKEQYGVWIAINGLLQWLYVSQIGLSGNALINKLSEANGQDNPELAQELVSTSFWTLTGLSAILLILFAAVFPFINWTWVFNSQDVIDPTELHLAIIFAFISFVMMFPTSMVDAVYRSYQEGYIGNIWNIAGSIFSLIALIIVTQTHGGLPSLVAALFGVRILFSFANAGYLFFFRHPWLKPRLGAVTKKSFRGMTNLGLKYLAAEFSGIGMFQSQPFIIIQIMGPAAVAVFGVAQKILTLPLTVIQVFTLPFMPAYGEAKARGDWDWIKKNLRQTTILATLGSIAMVVPTCLAAQIIIPLWTRNPELIPSTGLVWFFGLYVIVASAVTPASVMLYGVQRIGAQATIAFVNAILNVGLGIFLTWQFGVTGMAAAMVIALTLANPIGQIVEIRSVFKSIKSAPTD